MRWRPFVAYVLAIIGALLCVSMLGSHEPSTYTVTFEVVYNDRSLSEIAERELAILKFLNDADKITTVVQTQPKTSSEEWWDELMMQIDDSISVTDDTRTIQ